MNFPEPDFNGEEHFPFLDAAAHAARNQGVSIEPLPDVPHLFQYHNGEGYLYADPARVHRRMMIQSNGEWGALHKATRNKDLPAAERGAAAEQLLSTIALAFGLPVLESSTGEGLLEEQMWQIYNDFCNFLGKKKESSDSSQTSPQPTVSQESSDYSKYRGPSTPGSNPEMMEISEPQPPKS